MINEKMRSEELYEIFREESLKMFLSETRRFLMKDWTLKMMRQAIIMRRRY